MMSQEVERIVSRALSLHKADGIGMADYALESSGNGSVFALGSSVKNMTQYLSISNLGVSSV